MSPGVDTGTAVDAVRRNVPAVRRWRPNGIRHGGVGRLHFTTALTISRGRAMDGTTTPRKHLNKMGNGGMSPQGVIAHPSWPALSRPSPAAGDRGQRGTLGRANASGGGRLKAGQDGLWRRPDGLWPGPTGCGKANFL